MVFESVGSPSRTRTCDKSINSRLLYQLSYRGTSAVGRGYNKTHGKCKALIAAAA